RRLPAWLRSGDPAAVAGLPALACSFAAGCAGGWLCLSQPPLMTARPRTASVSDSEGNRDRDLSKGGSNQMWGGRFAEGPSAIMREINASIPFDKALWRQDIAASKAHVAMLGKQGIVSQDDVQAISVGLDRIAGEYAAN